MHNIVDSDNFHKIAFLECPYFASVIWKLFQLLFSMIPLHLFFVEIMRC